LSGTVRSADSLLGSEGFPITTWVPTLVFLAVFIEYSLKIRKEVGMSHHTSRGALTLSAISVGAKVLTHVIAGALLI